MDAQSHTRRSGFAEGLVSNGVSNEQLRGISPFLVNDTDVLLFDNGQLRRATITQSTEQHRDFAKNATEWEKRNSPLLTGSNRWTAIIDDAETIIAYAMIETITGVYHLWMRDVDGEVIAHQIIGEKSLEPDPWGNILATAVLTLGGGLVVRSMAAGMARAATTAVAAGARVVSLAISRIIAGEATEGVVLTALRSIRAQAIVKAVRARGASVVVNIGGEAGPEEVMKWGANQIALNHQVRMGIVRRFVPNLVKENGEKIGEVFGRNTIDKVVSRRLDANFDVNKLARGAFNVLKPGGTLEIQVYSPNPNFAATFMTALRNAGFRNVSVAFNVTFKAIK